MRPLNVHTIYSDTLANGGGTFRHHGQHVTSGYAVAVVDDTFRIVDIDDRVAFYVAIVDVTYEYPSDYIGTWVHDGSIYIDPSTVYAVEEDARRVAIERNQLAYYNITDDAEVTL